MLFFKRISNYLKHFPLCAQLGTSHLRFPVCSRWLFASFRWARLFTSFRCRFLGGRLFPFHSESENLLKMMEPTATDGTSNGLLSTDTVEDEIEVPESITDVFNWKPKPSSDDIPQGSETLPKAKGKSKSLPKNHDAFETERSEVERTERKTEVQHAATQSARQQIFATPRSNHPNHSEKARNFVARGFSESNFSASGPGFPASNLSPSAFPTCTQALRSRR